MRSLALLPLLIVLAGCQSPSLVGEWQAEGLAEQMTQSSYVLRADGTFSSTTSINSPLGVPIQVNATGKWTLRGNNFKTQVEALDVMGFDLDSQPDAPEQLRENRFRRLSGTLQWVSPDRFNLIADRTGTVVMFRRVVSERKAADSQ